jgi:hypothetical protein
MIGRGEKELDELLNILLAQKDIRLTKGASEFFPPIPNVDSSRSGMVSNSANKVSSDF